MINKIIIITIKINEGFVEFLKSVPSYKFEDNLSFKFLKEESRVNNTALLYIVSFLK